MPETNEIVRTEKKFLNRIVPGLVTGAADNDPAGVATYSLSGINFRYAQIWLLLLATPMLIAVQSMAVRLALVSKKGLSENYRKHYPLWIALTAVIFLVVSNILTIGANIAAMAEAASLLAPGTKLIHWVVPISFLIWYVVVFFNYRQIRKYFLWLILFFGAFVISAILARPDLAEIMAEIIRPQFQWHPAFISAAIALIGTTIAPYLFYWEAQETLEEKTPTKLARIEHWLQVPGFIISNFVSLMIIVATGTLLFGRLSGDVTAAQVAMALEPVAGSYAKLLFAVGILGAGFLAVPILASSAALAISGFLGWKEGLSLKPTQAKGFYEIISASILVGVQIAISGFDPIKALFFSQVISGILTGPLILLMLILANKKGVMGQFTNNWFENVFAGLAVALLLAAAAGLFINI